MGWTKSIALLALFAGLATIAPATPIVGSQDKAVLTTVGVGSHPRDIAVNPITNKVWVSNENAATVSVIDGATHLEIDTDGNSGNGITRVPVGSRPISLDVNPSTNKVYVANLDDGTVSVIDGASHGSTTITVGGNPTGVAVNSTTNRVYVGNSGSDSVTVIDGSADSVLTSVPLFSGADPHGLGVAVNEMTNRIYVANYQDPGTGTTVSVIDGATNTEIDTDGNPGNGLTRINVGTAPAGITVNPITNRVYVSTSSSNVVKVINGATHSVVATVPVSQPAGLSVDTDENLVYVVAEFGCVVKAIDGVTNTEVDSIPVSCWPFGIATNSLNNRTYVESWNSDVVTVIDDDDDADGVLDGADNCPLWPNPTQMLPPWTVPPGDTDCDGFTSGAETTITTDPGDACGFSAGGVTPSETWPPDLVPTNSVNVSDVLALKPVFGTAVPPTSQRLDVTPSGGINVSDVLALKPFFGKSCTP